MKKYLVALLNVFDNENIIYKVEAKNEIEAMKQALIDSCESEESKIDQRKWIDYENFQSIEDVQDYCFNSDMSISKPIEI